MSVVIVDPLYIHVIFSFSLNPLRRLRERVKRAMSSENQRILRKWKEVLVHNGINSSAGQWGIEFTSRRYGFLSIVFFFVMPDGSSGEIFCKWRNTTKRRRSALIGREIDSGEKAEAAAAPCREKKAKRENERRGLLREKAMDFRRKTTRLIFKLVRPSTEQRVTIQSHGCASRLVQLCGYLVVGASLFTSTIEWPSMRDRKSYASPTATMATTDINFDFNLFNKIKSISGRVFQETTMFAPWRRQNPLHLSSRSKQKEKNLFPTYFLAYSGVCGM